MYNMLIVFFQPVIDFSSSTLMEFELQSDQIYKVWPKQQNLGAFVQGRAGQVIDDKLTRYFEPLTTVRFTTMEFFPIQVTCVS